MFVKLYRSYIDRINKTLPTVGDNMIIHITDSGYTVNTDYIVYLEDSGLTVYDDATPEELKGTYHRIQIHGDPVNYYYITEYHYQQLLKAGQ